MIADPCSGPDLACDRVIFPTLQVLVLCYRWSSETERSLNLSACTQNVGKHVPFWPAKLESAGKCQRDRTVGRMYYAAPSVEESMKSARDTENNYIWPSLGSASVVGRVTCRIECVDD